ERIEDNLRYNQPGVLFVVGGNDIPGSVACACGAEALLIRRHVMIPKLPLRDIRSAEFPVLFRRIDAFEKALSLLLLREVQEELDDAGAVRVELSLQVHDRTIPVVPNRLLGEQAVREPLAAEYLRMDAGDQHLFVIGSIEDSDPPALGQIARGAPQKIVLQLLRTRMFEAKYL